MTSLQLFCLGSGIIVLAPGCQLAGHTSPWASTNWKALTSLKYSSGLRPTGKSLTEACLTMPFLSMIQVALKEMPISPPSSIKHPQALEISLLISETSGMSIGPSPPSFLDFKVYSICENLESTETASTSHPIQWNSLALLLKAMISVGQTKVKSRGQKKRTTYLPWQEFRSMSTKLSLNQAGATNWGAGFLTSDISYQYQQQIQLALLLPRTNRYTIVAVDMIRIAFSAIANQTKSYAGSTNKSLSAAKLKAYLKSATVKPAANAVKAGKASYQASQPTKKPNKINTYIRASASASKVKVLKPQNTSTLASASKVKVAAPLKPQNATKTKTTIFRGILSQQRGGLPLFSSSYICLY